MIFFCNVMIKLGHDKLNILQISMRKSLGSLLLFYRQTIFIDKQKFAWNFPDIFTPQFQRTKSFDHIWRMLGSYSLSCIYLLWQWTRLRGDWDYICVLIFPMMWWIQKQLEGLISVPGEEGYNPLRPFYLTWVLTSSKGKVSEMQGS